MSQSQCEESVRGGMAGHHHAALRRFLMLMEQAAVSPRYVASCCSPVSRRPQAAS